MAASVWKFSQRGIFQFHHKLCLQSCRNLRRIVPRVRVMSEEEKMGCVHKFMRDQIESEDAARHPGEMLTMDQVLKELNAKDPELDASIDIGLPPIQINKDVKLQQEKYLKEIRNSQEMEEAARKRTLKISLDEVKVVWQKTTGPQQIFEIAEHYGIYQDLFGCAHFLPVVPLNITYDYDDQFVTPVYRGNHVKPSEAKSAPKVNFEAKPDTLYTLTLVNPDGHLQDNSAEYLHWFIGNIPGNIIERGDLVCDYLQPFPPRGTGFHRMVFILYQQDKHIDYSNIKRPSPCLRLKDRTFKTFDFYKENQDFLTPVGLSFFQSNYDDSLTDFFHNVLSMREPVFEFIAPEPNIAVQKIIPHKKPFNLYLEKYRDPQDIGKEILLKRFKSVHPFKPDPPPLKYPCAHYISLNLPSWLRTEIIKERKRFGKYRGLDREIFKPERPKKFRLESKLDFRNLEW